MKKILVALLILILCAGGAAHADSLAAQGERYSNSLYSAKVAANVGDQVTIVLKESNTTKFDVDGNRSKSTKSDLLKNNNLSTQYGLLGVLFGNILNTENSFKRKMQTDISQSVDTTVSAQVIEVLPNGSLMIEAKKSMIINTEAQMVKIKGTIRREDINADNTILSNKVANADITVDGIGRSSNSHRSQGIFQQLLRVFF